jgi:hypothetical protein
MPKNSRANLSQNFGRDMLRHRSERLDEPLPLIDERAVREYPNGIRRARPLTHGPFHRDKFGRLRGWRCSGHARLGPKNDRAEKDERHPSPRSRPHSGAPTRDADGGRIVTSPLSAQLRHLALTLPSDNWSGGRFRSV